MCDDTFVRWEEGNENVGRSLAGFDLYGYRQEDGSILIGDTRDKKIDKWPDEITLFGTTFTFEEIQQGRFVEGKGQFENAVYL
jgi:hypothetical protein